MAARKANDTPNANLTGLLSAIVVGGVVGALVARLGGQQFAVYLREFHADSTSGSILFKLHSAAETLRPLAWFSPVWFALFYCVRRRKPAAFIVLCGLVGWIVAYSRDTYTHANPGPNVWSSTIEVPVWCFVATVAGGLIQVLRWKNETAEHTVHRSSP